MPDLNFQVVGAEIPLFASVPTLIFKMRITNAHDQEERIHSVMLRCQIRLAVTRRRYSPSEQERLLELFGEPSRWKDTLRDTLWTHAAAVVQQFTGSVDAELPVTCTYDFEVMSTKYFDALEDGAIPLLFLFSGTVFYEDHEENLQAAPIAWSKESSYRLPVSAWKEMIARYYPHSAWIRVNKDVFDQLYRYKATRGLPTWEEVITRLLQTSGEEIQP
jgi:Family of unknown function (DUF6084)